MHAAARPAHASPRASPRSAPPRPTPSRKYLARALSRPPLRASPRVSPFSRHAQACSVPRPLPCASSPIHVIPLVAASRLARSFVCLRRIRRAAPRLAPVALPRPARPHSLCPRRAALIFPSGFASISPHPALSLPRWPRPASFCCFVPTGSAASCFISPCSASPRSLVIHVHLAPPTCHRVLLACCFTHDPRVVSFALRPTLYLFCKASPRITQLCMFRPTPLLCVSKEKGTWL